MDPEFTRVMIVVFSIACAIGAVGATLLYFAFRAFGKEKSGSRPVILFGALVAFVFACSLALFAWSYFRER